MTFNELEMFLNDDNETNKKIDEFSQKIDSDHNTVYYYKSGMYKLQQEYVNMYIKLFFKVPSYSLTSD